MAKESAEMDMLLEQDALEDLKPKEADLSLFGEVGRYVNKLKDLQQQLEKEEYVIQQLKEAIAEVSEKKIPDLFDQLGIDSLKLQNGQKVTIDRGYAVNLTKETKPAAYEWLKNNGHESLIKHAVEIVIKKGEKEEYEKITKLLDSEGVSYKDSEDVHHSTLKAFVNEQMRTPGSNFPEELFKVFSLTSTKIK